MKGPLSMAVGVEYMTWAGDRVRCVKWESHSLYVCEYVGTVGSHRRLQGSCDIWTERGFWAKMPGGVHDIVGEAE